MQRQGSVRPPGASLSLGVEWDTVLERQVVVETLKAGLRSPLDDENWYVCVK